MTSSPTPLAPTPPSKRRAPHPLPSGQAPGIRGIPASRPLAASPPRPRPLQLSPVPPPRPPAPPGPLLPLSPPGCQARVVRNKGTQKSLGYGFVSFKDPWDMTKALREMHGKYIGNRPVKASPPHHSSPPRHRRASTPRPFRCARAPGPSAARSSQAPNSSGCTRWQSTTRRSGANSRRPRASSGRTCTRGRRTCPGDCDRRRAPRSVWGERVAESRLQRVQRSALCSLPGSPATSTTGRRAHAPRPPHAPRSRSALAPQRSSAHDCVGAGSWVHQQMQKRRTLAAGTPYLLCFYLDALAKSLDRVTCLVPRTS